jgi:hypothetical protein
VSSAAITLCVAAERVIPKVSVYFVIDSVRKLLDTPSYVTLRKAGTGSRPCQDSGVENLGHVFVSPVRSRGMLLPVSLLCCPFSFLSLHSPSIHLHNCIHKSSLSVHYTQFYLTSLHGASLIHASHPLSKRPILLLDGCTIKKNHLQVLMIWHTLWEMWN